MLKTMSISPISIRYNFLKDIYIIIDNGVIIHVRSALSKSHDYKNTTK